MSHTSMKEDAVAAPELTPALPRRLLAEFLGTALLLAVVAGSGIMGEQLAMVSSANLAANSNANPAAIAGLALLANSLATGAGLFVLIMLFGPVSGAHFNPVVSLVAMLQRQLSVRALAGYVSAQILGGVSGILATHAMFNLALWQASTKVRSGGHLWWAELVATFGLVLTIQGLSRRQAALPAIGASVALYIVAAYWFTASTSFANPAVTLARTLTDTFTGIRLQDVTGFILAQVIGALLALGCARLLFAEPAAT